MKDKLYIIGNGFDRAHGIKSDYKDFMDYCEGNAHEYYAAMNCLYDKRKKLWSKFE
jgi:hypothetical protein